MIKSNKLLGVIALIVPLFVVGCGKEPEEKVGSQVEYQVENDTISETEQKNIIKVSGRKVKVGELSARIPKKWERIDVDDMLLYKIDNNKGNLSLVIDDTKGYDFEGYVSKAKDLLSETIDLSKAEIEVVQFGKNEGRTIQYRYNLEGEMVNIYQVCFVENGKAYIFTMGSSDEMLELNKENVNSVLENISFKK